MKIFNLSWKNIWRNPVRSGVVICSVFLGTWAGLFIAAFSSGMTRQYIRDNLNTYIGHIQVYNPKFEDERKSEFRITNPDSIIRIIKQYPQVKDVARHTIADGLAQSSANSFGISLVGIQPDEETQVTSVHSFIKEGSYFGQSIHNPIVIGEKLANRLKLRLKSKIVISFQNINGDITSAAFRVAGIFKTNNSNFDERTVFTTLSVLSKLLGKPGIVHNLLILTTDFKQAPKTARKLQSQFPKLSIKDWGEISPQLRYADSSMDLSLYIFMGIIVLALTLGIINTMLMAVLERTRELGMLMAIGMNKIRIFSMILSETFFLVFVGAPLGMVTGWTSISLLSNTGIDLGAFSEGLSEYGISSVIYPLLEHRYYFIICAMMIIATLIGAIYPALKALKLKPVEAIRKI